LAQRDKLREFAFSGIAVYSKDIFNRIQREGKFSLTDLFIELSPSGAIFGYDHTGDVLMDVGSEEKRIRAEQLFV